MTITRPAASVPLGLRRPLAWGVVLGVVQALAPLALPWLHSAVVYALSLPLIAAVYIGFAVADGRPHVLAVETAVVAVFVTVAAAAVTFQVRAMPRGRGVGGVAVVVPRPAGAVKRAISRAPERVNTWKV